MTDGPRRFRGGNPITDIAPANGGRGEPVLTVYGGRRFATFKYTRNREKE